MNRQKKLLLILVLLTGIAIEGSRVFSKDSQIHQSGTAYLLGLTAGILVAVAAMIYRAKSQRKVT